MFLKSVDLDQLALSADLGLQSFQRGIHVYNCQSNVDRESFR